MSFAKVHSDLLVSSVWEEELHVRVAWITLLVLADRDGLVFGSTKGLATQARLSHEQMLDALRVLSSPDEDSGSPEHDGRRIIPVEEGGRRALQIVNYSKYRRLASAEERAEKDRERKRAARGGKACDDDDDDDETLLAASSRPQSSARVRMRPHASATVRTRPQSSANSDKAEAEAEADPEAEDPPKPPVTGGTVPPTLRTPSAALRSLEAALELPAAERAEALGANPHLAQWARPQDWPEVRQVAEQLATALGHAKPKLGSYERDAGVRQIVGLLADGFTLDELAAACASAKSDPWMREARRGAGALTPEVVRRLLAPAPNPAQKRATGPAWVHQSQHGLTADGQPANPHIRDMFTEARAKGRALGGGA